MRANDLPEAIKLQNGPDYGLTAGIHSLGNLGRSNHFDCFLDWSLDFQDS
jgi:acyl-CoA reductase-like NAD-dependent aldehyde dehydrogenase